MPESDSTRRLPLFEMIQDLREEIAMSREFAKGKDIQFNVEDIDLEFHVQITKDVTAGMKYRFWVLEAGAEGGLSKQDTQLFRLKLKPTGGPIPVGDTSTTKANQPG